MLAQEAPSTSSTEAPEAPVEVESVTPLHASVSVIAADILQHFLAAQSRVAAEQTPIKAFLDLSESVEQDHQVSASERSGSQDSDSDSVVLRSISQGRASTSEALQGQTHVKSHKRDPSQSWLRRFDTLDNFLSGV